MSKTLTESTISTANARSKLKEGVHWRGLNADVHLGYRKGKRGGRWLVRWYKGEQEYQQETLATADDALEADGINCLTFEQAKSRALDTVKDRRAEERALATGPAPTVRSAVLTYVTLREARDRERHAARSGDARARLSRHVLTAPLAEVKLHKLTEDDLKGWKAGLSPSLAPGSVRRLVNDLKAVLNSTAAAKRSVLPAELSGNIRHGLKSDEDSTPIARDKQALPDDDIRRIIEASRQIDAQGWEGDLLRMVAVLAATGAGFSQVRRLMVGDLQIAQSRLMVPVSYKGRGRKQQSHVAVRIGADVIELLRPTLADRRSSDPLLERWRHKQVPGVDGRRPRWVRDRRAPWLNATELTRPWLEILKLAGLPADVVPYALRHSSIVRQLRAGLPVRLVAALHDTSTKMIEAHYAAALVDALDDLAAGAVVSLIPAQSTGENVINMSDRIRA